MCSIYFRSVVCWRKYLTANDAYLGYTISVEKYFYKYCFRISELLKKYYQYKIKIHFKEIFPYHSNIECTALIDVWIKWEISLKWILIIWYLLYYSLLYVYIYIGVVSYLTIFYNVRVSKIMFSNVRRILYLVLAGWLIIRHRTVLGRRTTQA